LLGGVTVDSHEAGAPPSEPPAVLRLVLCDQRDDRGSRYEEARVRTDGGVTIIGEDSGSGVEDFFGSGIEDYEWTYDVDRGHLPQLIAALGGERSDDVLALIGDYYASQGGAALGQLLGSAPVNAAFHSYHS
jgi:hypothetical protein